MRKWDRRHVLGVAVLLMVAAALAAVFSLLSRTDMKDLSLDDSADERFGWRYVLLVNGQARDYEPVFSMDGYQLLLPEGTEAVRLTRTMTEDIQGAELAWYTWRDGVELFLDGRQLYTDFPGAARNEDGFLHLAEADWEPVDAEQNEPARRMRMALPANYCGRELSVVTYFSAHNEFPTPVYPFIGTEASSVAELVVSTLKSDAALTVYALLTLLLAVMYLQDLSNDGSDPHKLLLCLYFFLLFFRRASFSYTGYYSGLNSRLDFGVVHELYMAPLYLYVALKLRRQWRMPLCTAVIAWTLYEAARWFWDVRQGLTGSANTVGPAALVVFLAVAVAACIDVLPRWCRKKRRALLMGIVAAGVLAVYLFEKIRVWNGVGDYLRNGLWVALRMGNFGPVLDLLTDLVSVMVLIAVISGFAGRVMRTRQEMSVLQDREQQAMASYQRLLTAQDAVHALRHEMRHHMMALSGILHGGDLERAKRYVDAVAGEFDQLPTGRYSPNMLVDVIAGSYLDHACALHIQVEHRLNVPPEMNIADEDLSVFLSNMLQNALEACELMGKEAERFIRVDMHLRGNFLFVKCVNSAPPLAAEQENRQDHGYGLAAMRRIAEKYNSMLILERTDSEFSVKSDLYLKKG